MKLKVTKEYIFELHTIFHSLFYLFIAYIYNENTIVMFFRIPNIINYGYYNPSSSCIHLVFVSNFLFYKYCCSVYHK